MNVDEIQAEIGRQTKALATLRNRAEQGGTHTSHIIVEIVRGNDRPYEIDDQALIACFEASIERLRRELDAAGEPEPTDEAEAGGPEQ